MSDSRGKVHTYLGMKLNFTLPGRVKITMLDYVEEIIVAFEKADTEACGTKTSAPPTYIFTVDMQWKEAECTQGNSIPQHRCQDPLRHETCQAIRGPDTDDWVKLAHLIKYLRGTKTLPFTLSDSNGGGILKWWVDGSFAVHPNIRGHTGGGLSMGRASEGAFLWVMQAPVLLFKDSAVFSTESDK
jgi:hypothetical protein